MNPPIVDAGSMRQQKSLFALGFPIIKVLVMQKKLGGVYNMDDTSHVRVD
jgi:hypothetical protein